MKLVLSIVIILLIVIFIVFNINKYNNNKKETFIKKNIWKLIPLNKNEANYVFDNLKDTNYVKQFSIYDIQSKTNSEDSKNRLNYIEYSKKQILEWSEKEKKLIYIYYNKFINRLIELNIIDKWLKLPNINIIKSTMKHEGNAEGYTIENNIVIKNIGYDLLVHELFHVFSRHNPKLAEKMYKIFKIWVADEIIYPKKIKNLLISNPDTPKIVFTTIMFQGKETLVSPIIHSDKKYDGKSKSFFDDMQVSLLFVDLRIYDEKLILIHKDMNQYNINNSILPIENVKEYTNKLGNNTDYNIHPEEVSAKHFEFLINGSWKTKPNPELITKFYNLIK